METNRIDEARMFIRAAYACEADALTGTRADYVAQDIETAREFWCRAFIALMTAAVVS